MPSCPERLRLGKAVVATVDAVFTARRKLESARTAKTPDVAELAGDLDKAKSATRDAQRAFDNHITVHACQS